MLSSMPHHFARMTSVLAVVVALSVVGCDSGPADDPTPELSLELRQLIEQSSNGEGISYFVLPESNDFNAIPQDPNNPLSTAKVTLGQFLYHETALAQNPVREEGRATYSCASCHHSKAGFQSGRRQGLGEGGLGYGVQGESRFASAVYSPEEIDLQPIRTPTAMNGAWQKVMLWNGQFGATGPNAGTEAQWTTGTPKETNHLGFEGLETQSIAGLKVHRMDVENSPVVENPVYRELFDQAFAEVPESERYTRTTAGLAIAAYERTLLSNRAPFQDWLRGDEDAMSEFELRGAILFFGKAGCVACHTGPALNSMTFYSYCMHDLEGPGVIGGVDDPTRRGRGGFTGNPDDDYKFKTPQLYNLYDARFFGHGASFHSVRDVIKYKNQGRPQDDGIPDSQIAEEFRPLGLTETEIDELAAFVESALYDPFLERYQPSSLPSGECIIVNDGPSRIDLGCD